MEKKTIAALVGAGAMSLTMGTAPAQASQPQAAASTPSPVTTPSAEHSPRLGRRLHSLERALNLTDAQMPAWRAFSQARRSIAGERTRFRDSRQWIQDAQERLELRAERARIRAEQLTAIARTRRALITVLSDEQRETLDRMTAPRRTYSWNSRMDDQDFDEI